MDQSEKVIQAQLEVQAYDAITAATQDCPVKQLEEPISIEPEMEHGHLCDCGGDGRVPLLNPDLMRVECRGCLSCKNDPNVPYEHICQGRGWLPTYSLEGLMKALEEAGWSCDRLNRNWQVYKLNGLFRRIDPSLAVAAQAALMAVGLLEVGA